MDVWRKSKARLTRGSFLQHAATLMTGTALAQMITIAISPVLTRIFTPDEFGIFNLYLSIVSIISVFVSGRYELAIIIPESDEEAIQVSLVAIFFTVSISLFISLGIILGLNFGGDRVLSLFGLPSLGFWIYFIPLVVFILGLHQTLYFWFNRQKQYKLISRNRILQSSGTALISTGIGAFINGAHGLFFGHLLSNVFVLTSYLRQFFLQYTERNPISSYKMLIKIAIRYINFPKYLIPAHTLNAAALHLPVVILAAYYGAYQAGFFALTQRVLRLPLTVVATSIGDVFRQRASEEMRITGQCKNLYLKTFLLLAGGAFIPFATLFLTAPLLFSWIFGDEWKVSGEFAKIITLVCYLQFITSPLSNLFFVAEKQKWDLIFQVCIFVFPLLAMVIAHNIWGSISNTILFHSLTYSLLYAINLLVSFQISKGK
jgi:O-antigen/teichoic acid export membrane protein